MRLWRESSKSQDQSGDTTGFHAFSMPQEGAMPNLDHRSNMNYTSQGLYQWNDPGFSGFSVTHSGRGERNTSSSMIQAGVDHSSSNPDNLSDPVHLDVSNDAGYAMYMTTSGQYLTQGVPAVSDIGVSRDGARSVSEESSPSFVGTASAWTTPLQSHPMRLGRSMSSQGDHSEQYMAQHAGHGFNSIYSNLPLPYDTSDLSTGMHSVKHEVHSDTGSVLSPSADNGSQFSSYTQSTFVTGVSPRNAPAHQLNTDVSFDPTRTSTQEFAKPLLKYDNSLPQTTSGSNRSRHSHRRRGVAHASTSSDVSETQISGGSYMPTLSGDFVERGSLEMQTNAARDHPLYYTATVQPDGLYHCPFEGEEGCSHQPTKLKCNYDKHVDAHLKPYRCKFTSYLETPFSSTACLLRHEREAHGMHGHGERPHLCPYEDCDRSKDGHGFPRHWNLKDHMRRVHHDSGASPPLDSGSSALSSGARRARKRKASAAEAARSRKLSRTSLPKGSPPEAPRSARSQLEVERRRLHNLLQERLRHLPEAADKDYHEQLQQDMEMFQEVTTNICHLDSPSVKVKSWNEYG